MIAYATSNGIVIVAATIGACGAVLAAMIAAGYGIKLTRKVNEVHAVNSRLDRALAEIEQLRKQRREDWEAAPGKFRRHTDVPEADHPDDPPS